MMSRTSCVIYDRCCDVGSCSTVTDIPDIPRVLAQKPTGLAGDSANPPKTPQYEWTPGCLLATGSKSHTLRHR